MAETEYVVWLVDVVRLNNSVNGNPRYRLAVRTIPGGLPMTLTTMSDIGDAYSIGNPGIRPGCRVRVTLSRVGRVRHIRKA